MAEQTKTKVTPVVKVRRLLNEGTRILLAGKGVKLVPGVVNPKVPEEEAKVLLKSKFVKEVKAGN